MAGILSYTQTATSTKVTYVQFLFLFILNYVYILYGEKLYTNKNP
jgi:hypothetical protein